MMQLGVGLGMINPKMALEEISACAKTLLNSFKNKESPNYIAIVGLKAIMLVENCDFTQNFLKMIPEMPGIEKETETVVQTTKTIVGNTKSAQIGYLYIILMAC